MIRFRAHRLKVREMVFSPCGGFLLTRGASDPEPALWDAATGGFVRRYVRRDQILNGRPDRSEVRWPRFAPCGRWFAAYDGGSVAVWDIDREEQFREVSDDSMDEAFDFHPVTGELACGTLYYSPPNRPVERRRFLNWWPLPGRDDFYCASSRSYPIPLGFGRGLAIGPDGRYLASGTRPGVDLYRTDPWGWYTAIPFPEPLHRSFGERLLRYRANLLIGTPAKVEVWTAGDDPPARLFTVSQRRHGNRSLAGADLSPDGRTALTAGTDGTAALWDVHSGAERSRFDWHLGRLSAAATSPDGCRWAVGGANGEVVVWDAD